MNLKQPYAEDMNYWQTSQSSPDTWIEKARKEIVLAGGKNISEGFAQDAGGVAAYVFMFTLNDEPYRIQWPVLKSRTGKQMAARRQAATMLYYDVKARCLSARVLGARVAFLPFLVLPDGRTAGTAAAPELVGRFPKLLTTGE